MNQKNIKIGTQLKIGFAVMLAFVAVLGVVSHLQATKIHIQTESMYEHPLKTKRALGKLEADIFAIHRDMKDLFLSVDKKEIALDLNRIEAWQENAFEQIDTLYACYLGPRSELDSLKKAFVVWNSMRAETIRLFQKGNTEEAISRTKTYGVGGTQVNILLSILQKIDIFAKNKGDQLYSSSEKLRDTLSLQLIFLVTAILVISLIINFFLLYNIRKPLRELTDATRRFHDGDLSARSPYDLQNEFGALSSSFNNMAESIQVKIDLDEKVAALAGLMLSEYDARKFFKTTINALAMHTGSQMAAVYMLSEDKQSFDHFESIGVGDNARQSFAAKNLEGEFGAVISSHKVQHISNIPENTRFVFNTVSGKFIPKEIITLPITSDNNVVAIISIASVNAYSKQSTQLINRIMVTLCARVEGILAYHKITEFLEKLELQNRELEAQKTELSTQSAELTEQNSELEMQKKQLNETNRLKTNFLSNMSHELRTPLNSVIALSGVLNRRLMNVIGKEEYSYLEVIERNGKHLLSLINDILDISRIEAGKEEYEISTFNVNSLMLDVTGLILPQAQQKKISLIHSDSDLNLFVSSDYNKCVHILQNLVGNAVKFTEKGKVEVTARQKNNRIFISVKDTGIGISEKNLPFIFDEFRQADGGTSRKFGGTGLGLAIASKYAHLIGGEISVKSVLGEGSEFILSLPLRYSAEQRIVKTEKITGVDHSIKHSPAPIISDSSLKTILLVEDSEPAIVQIKDFLEDSGYKILVARDGNEALGIIAQIIPDAMILDLMMPVVDGFEVLKTLREAEPTMHIPVLILTAKHITKEDLRFLKRNNVHQLIQKGDVKRNELLRAVTNMVRPIIAETVVEPQRKIQNIQGKPVVLIIEDNSDSMITAKAILADNFSLIEAVDGIQGIEMAKKYVPNLILMDIELPGIDGVDSFKAIRSDLLLQHIPIIALTASAMVSDRETILAYGFDAYVAKPIDETILFKIIDETLYGK